MPSWRSSQTVSRAPWFQGRVSPANTRPIFPRATPARITPSAVPNPAVASEPVLQCVSTPLPGAISPAPSVPIRRFAARSSASIRCASASITSCQSPPAASSTRRIRASAQARLTAVGRAASRRAIAGARRTAAAAPSAASTPRAASTTPQAAAMPIAGAPRTASARIAPATSSESWQETYSTVNGSRRWSSSSSAVPVQRMGRMRS